MLYAYIFIYVYIHTYIIYQMPPYQNAYILKTNCNTQSENKINEKQIILYF